MGVLKLGYQQPMGKLNRQVGHHFCSNNLTTKQ